MDQSLSSTLIDSIVGGYNGDPFAVLGPHLVTHEGQPSIAIRAFLPWAASLQAVFDDGPTYEMWRLHPAGFFEAIVPQADVQNTKYVLRADNGLGSKVDLRDVYSFGPILTDFDLYLISEGSHYRTYEKLGAHVREIDGVWGIHFAVWAPNAERVSVIGNFNSWEGNVDPMRNRPGHGIWELFIPGLGEGESYKYQIKIPGSNAVTEKADPYGFFAEYRPGTASIVSNIDHYDWQDGQWLQERPGRQALSAPISIYEVHLGSWKRTLADSDGQTHQFNYRQLAHELVEYCQYMGFTHIELMPISEHPFDGSWGYQTIGYYAVTSRYGTPADFQYFVDYCHKNGIGVLLDWVPAHFPTDAHGLGFFDGTHLYEHADPRLGSHPDWGTLIFNYGRNEVRNFLLSNALFWLDKYHIDGLRVDAVASMLYLNFSRPDGAWVPNKYGGTENLDAIDFIRRFNELTHLEHPDVLTMAEDSTNWPGVTRPTFLGGLGFDLKWNMGWMNDVLSYFSFDPIYRRYHHNLLTFSLTYAFSENFLLPLSHDEVVHLKKSLLEKMPGDNWQKFAGLRLLLGYQFTHPGKKLLFMGDELAQRAEWNERTSITWQDLESEAHRGVNNFVRDMAHLYKNDPAFHVLENSWDGFKWLNANDNENSVISFMRIGPDGREKAVVICNFTPLPRYNYRIPVPQGGYYREVLNSDAGAYWGSNIGNSGGVWAEENPWGASGWELGVTVPPLAVLILKPDTPQSDQPEEPQQIEQPQEDSTATEQSVSEPTQEEQPVEDTAQDTTEPEPAPSPEPAPEESQPAMSLDDIETSEPLLEAQEQEKETTLSLEDTDSGASLLKADEPEA